jgi:hypothetical protein
MKQILYFLIAFFYSLTCFAQRPLLDSLKLSVGSNGTFSSSDYQPLWLVSNRFGAISDTKSDLSTFISLSNTHLLTNKHKTGLTGDRALAVSYGLDLYNHKNFDRTFLQQAYIKVNYGALQLRVGRYKEIIGEVDHELSTGSLGVSGNALPIPKLGIALTKYTDVPWTNGWIQVKGLISHGWMGQNQYMKDAYLHEKTLYLRVGKNKLKLYGGIEHFAVWGGNRAGGMSLDRSFKGFMNVFLVKEANDGSVNTEIDRPNRAGDHRGVLEGGLEYEFDKLKLHVYNQTPFDMGQGIDIRNIDRLFGVALTNKKDSFWKKVVAEFIYTKQMNDFYPAQYRESYYNNGIYKTGWEYENQIIGTPLFVNRQRGVHYFPNIPVYDWKSAKNNVTGNNIINNQVVGGHLGAIYKVMHQLEAKTLLTYTRNYSTFLGMTTTPLNQCYTLQEFAFSPSSLPALSFTGGLAYDFGQLSKNIGGMVGLKWQLIRH